MGTDQNVLKKKFFDSVKRGTGEAWIILKSNPTLKISTPLIKASLTNFAYDPQCEGSRAQYLYRLIKISNQKEKILHAIIKNLPLKKDDYYGLDQICDLLVMFFNDGYTEARTALSQLVTRSYKKGYEPCGFNQIIELEGMAGLLTVAEIAGKNIYKEKGAWEDSWRVDNFQKKHKKIPVYTELEKAAEKNKFIRAYYMSILENKWRSAKRRRTIKFSYKLVEEKINTNKFRVISEERANDLSRNEVKKLAENFLTEKDAHRKELYLRFFAKRKFPFAYDSLLKIVRSNNPKDTRLVEFAVYALSYFKGRDIRKLALAKLSGKKNPGYYLNLLVNNYKPEDYKLLAAIANRSNDYHYIHSIVSGLVHIYTSNHTRKCKKPLETIYNKMNCGIHRNELVQVLKDNNVLSETIRSELRYDSYKDLTRFLSK